MRAKLVGALAAFALSFLGFLASASADPIRPGNVGWLIGDVSILNTGGRDHSEALRSDQGWVRMSDDLDRLNLPNVANGNRQKVTAFRGEKDHRGGETETGGFGEARNPVAAGNLGQTTTVTVPAIPGAQPMPTLPLGAQAPADPLGLTMPATIAMTGQPLPTPEPASLVLLVSGLAGLGVFGVRRRKRL